MIRGPKADVENAKRQLEELVEDRKINSYTAEIHAKPEFHKFLIGRGGVNIKKVGVIEIEQSRVCLSNLCLFCSSIDTSPY